MLPQSTSFLLVMPLDLSIKLNSPLRNFTSAFFFHKISFSFKYMQVEERPSIPHQNIYGALNQRSIGNVRQRDRLVTKTSLGFLHSVYPNQSFVARLKKQRELKKHRGCVNTGNFYFVVSRINEQLIGVRVETGLCLVVTIPIVACGTCTAMENSPWPSPLDTQPTSSAPSLCQSQTTRGL